MGLSALQKTLVTRAHRARQLKLESGMNGESNRWSPEEAINGAERPESSLEWEDERAALLGRLDRLDDRERTIISLRYGLEGGAPMTLKEIGRRLGVTREWVRKIEVRAVRKLDDRPEAEPTARRGARRLSRRAMSPASRPTAAASC